MAVPLFYDFMLPFLELLADGREQTMAEMKEAMAKKFKLSEEEMKELLPSGKQAIFDNRIGWAGTYLKKALLIDSPKRAVFRITPRGHEVLKMGLKVIKPAFLKQQYEEFREFVTPRSKDQQKNEIAIASEDETPLETFETAYKKIKEDLKKELLDTIFSCSPSFFEKLVVDLLLNLGYGGSRKEAGEAFMSTGDEGIDGIIKEDKLGLDVIYIQAKRWKRDTPISRPEVQKFAGALQGKRAKKGVFITTSSFSSDAKKFSQGLDSKIILIDGDSLTEYMIESGTGVSSVFKYEIKRLDSDYFNEE